MPQKGPGRAFREALHRIRHDFVICLDIDLSTDLNFIDDAVLLLERYDVVVGSKIVGSDSRSFIRKLGSRIFIFFAGLLLDLDIADYSIGTKAFRSEILQQYRDAVDNHTAYTLNILHEARKDGKRIIEIGVRCLDERASRFNLLHEAGYKFYSLYKLLRRERKVSRQ